MKNMQKKIIIIQRKNPKFLKIVKIVLMSIYDRNFTLSDDFVFY